jgi:hypothetical protein
VRHRQPADSRQVPIVPSGYRTAEPWPLRILSWLYPSRGWGGGHRPVDQESRGNHPLRPGPPLPTHQALQTGETR